MGISLGILQFQDFDTFGTPYSLPPKALIIYLPYTTRQPRVG